MSVIHLRVNEFGIEIVDDDNAPPIERAMGLARNASETLQHAVDMLELSGGKDIPAMRRLDDALRALRTAMREIDNG